MLLRLSIEHSIDYYKYILSKTKKSGEGLKILTPKQILHRLPIALA